jgi:hypothetical protein
MLVRWFSKQVAVGKLLFHHTQSITMEEKAMTTAATHHEHGNTTEATLLVAFERSDNTWKLGFITQESVHAECYL